MQPREGFIEMRVPASAKYVSLIRLTLSGVFSGAGATYDDIEDAKIAVSEAVTNVVKHTYEEKDNVGITNIYFEVLESKIRIVISDKGDSLGYETTKSKISPYNKGKSIDFLCEGGLGLFLIESLMDEVAVYKGSGATISMTKYMKKEQARDDDERVEIS